MIKCREIADILLVTDTISTYRKKRYLKRRCDTILIWSISAITIFSIYRPTSGADALADQERNTLLSL